MNGAIPPLLNTLSWRGAELKSTEITLPLALSLPFSKQNIEQHFKQTTGS
jgi:hypothetical protein